MFKVGQTLWYVPRWNGNSREVTIQKVGRVWLTLSNGERCDMKLMVNGNQSPNGRVYLSREAYEAEQALRKAWSAFAMLVRGHRQPDGVTIEKIKQASALLGL